MYINVKTVCCYDQKHITSFTGLSCSKSLPCSLRRVSKLNLGKLYEIRGLFFATFMDNVCRTSFKHSNDVKFSWKLSDLLFW